ncbi:protein matrimony-like [Drosophila innubila]|uniref:protein matrimony-like n=1 Tax=Drosophila innubila TaxID=198719 RepID=UPI00148BDDF6|nr:protein matrimony-like [Drosophila innubila]
MTESHTPTNRRKLCFNRTPNVKSEIVFNTLNVNSINVRCFTPILGEFRSPNLSPIMNMRSLKSPVSPMSFRKPLKKMQQQQEQQQVAPPLIKVSGEKKTPPMEEDNDNSLNNFLDDSSNDNIETSLTVETRRRCKQANNHSYVINHASNVKEVLLMIGLDRYLDTFEKSHIELIDLVSMKRADLKKIGLRRNEDCDCILDALKTL